MGKSSVVVRHGKVGRKSNGFAIETNLLIGVGTDEASFCVLLGREFLLLNRGSRLGSGILRSCSLFSDRGWGMYYGGERHIEKFATQTCHRIVKIFVWDAERVVSLDRSQFARELIGDGRSAKAKTLQHEGNNIAFAIERCLNLTPHKIRRFATALQCGRSQNDNKMSPRCNVLKDYALKVTTSNAVIVYEDIVAVLSQMLPDGERPREICAAIADKDRFVDAFHSRYQLSSRCPTEVRDILKDFRPRYSLHRERRRSTYPSLLSAQFRNLVHPLREQPLPAFVGRHVVPPIAQVLRQTFHLRNLALDIVRILVAFAVIQRLHQLRRRIAQVQRNRLRGHRIDARAAGSAAPAQCADEADEVAGLRQRLPVCARCRGQGCGDGMFAGEPARSAVLRADQRRPGAAARAADGRDCEIARKGVRDMYSSSAPYVASTLDGSPLEYPSLLWGIERKVDNGYGTHRQICLYQLSPHKFPVGARHLAAFDSTRLRCLHRL